jgi:predicted alpha-1,6-mannanase (GH76 family)
MNPKVALVVSTVDGLRFFAFNWVMRREPTCSTVRPSATGGGAVEVSLIRSRSLASAWVLVIPSRLPG